MNWFRPLSYLRRGSSDPSPADLPRLRKSPLARVLLALLSAALLVCSLPQPDIRWLGWVALVPLILACEGLSPGRAAGLGFLSGFISTFGIYHWIFNVPAFGWRHAVTLAAILALYPTLFHCTLTIAIRRRVPLLLAVPMLWGGLDYLRAHAGFLAFPWATLAHSQHDNLPLLQVASLVGEHGVSACVALGNAVIAESILRFRRTDTGVKSAPDRYAAKYEPGTWYPVGVAAENVRPIVHAVSSATYCNAQEGPMTEIRDERGIFVRPNQSTDPRWIGLTIGIALLLAVPATSTDVAAMGRLLSPASDPGLEITCSNPVMKNAPTFIAFPKGSAKYPFTSYCTSPRVPGAMTLRWEGSWNPSETRPDRPNASESITITSYEGFLPSREPGGKIFMYWTGRCDNDPWLQPSTCDRFGSYVPPDVRDALSRFDHERFPLTWKSISVGLKQQLIKQYQQANQPASPQQRVQNMTIQPPQSQAPITQSQRTQAMTVQPQIAVPKPSTRISPLARSGVFARGVEEKEDQESGQQDKDAFVASVETTDTPVIEEERPEIVDPVALHLDRVVYTLTATPEAIVLKPGIYEFGLIMGLQLALAKEGQPTVLLNAHQETHTESITRNMALVLSGRSDDVHLVLLTPDGRRFDAIGTTSGVMSRGTDIATAIPNERLTQAVLAASAKPQSVSSPACQPNPADTGPRWLPIPCSIPAAQSAPPGGRP